MTDAVLRVEALSKSFPGLKALDNVSIEIRPREVVGLVGENGAGKSTLLKMLAGLYAPDSGRIVLRGEEVRLKSVAHAAQNGIGMVFQEQSLLPNITVAENIMLGHEGEAVRFGLYDWPKLFELAREQLAKLGSSIEPSAQTDSLSFGERQVVELAKVLTIEERTRHEPIVLFDEPTSVLEAEEIDMVLNQIRRLRERASVVFISHRMDEVLQVSDRVYVMTGGRCVAERDHEACDAVELQELMLGRELSKEYERRPRNPAEIGETARLSVRNLLSGHQFQDISFDVRPGEILGIAGVGGSGREEVCRAIFGARDFEGGEIVLDGKPVRFADPSEAVAAGIGYLPAERRVEGVVGGMSVRENMTLAYIRSVMRGMFIDRGKEDRLSSQWIERLSIKTRSSETPVGLLSGGNQQKVALTKWLIASNPKIFILDHPMRGLDVGAKAEIFNLIRDLSIAGVSIILIADTLDELIALSDTILVMRDGRITGRFDVGDTPPTQMQILDRMI